jgi:hypothetical protein
MRKAADLIALWHAHFGAGFFGRGAGGLGGFAFALDFFASGKEIGGEKAAGEEKEQAHGGEVLCSRNYEAAARTMSDTFWAESA